MLHQLIADEKFTNIQKAQAGLSKLFAKAEESQSFYRVMRNDKPLGMLVPNSLWESILEDMEAMASEQYQQDIAASRRSKKRYSSEEIEKELGL